MQLYCAAFCSDFRRKLRNIGPLDFFLAANFDYYLAIFYGFFLSAKKFITFFKANSTQKTLKGSRNIQFFALIPADLFDIIASFASRSNFLIQIFKMATNFVVATLSFCILSLLIYVQIRLFKTKLSTR